MKVNGEKDGRGCATPVFLTLFNTLLKTLFIRVMVTAVINSLRHI